MSFVLLDLAVTDERFIFRRLVFQREDLASAKCAEWIEEAKLHGGLIELRRGTEYGEVIASYSGFAETE